MNTKPIRILYVVNDAGFFLSHRLPLAIGARDAGYDVHVATPESPDVCRIVNEGFPHHPISMHRSRTSALAELGSLRSLYRLYKRVRPDIVHNVTIKPVIYGGIAARLARVPAVVSAVSGLGYVFISKGVRAALLRSVVRPFYRVALGAPNARVILQNPDDRSMLLEQGVLKEKDAVLIRGSGVDVLRYALQPEDDGLPVVTLASRMLWDKGVGEFVEAARRLKKEGVDARFVLVGGVDTCNPASIPQEQLEAWVREGVVEWWGFRDDIPEVFRRSYIVCLPSYREGLPKVLIEAAACGRPIVASDVPGCREVAIHGQNALLVPPQNAHALAEALQRLIGDAELRRQMGRRGRTTVEQGFTIEKVLKETLDIYDELIERNRRVS